MSVAGRNPYLSKVKTAYVERTVIPISSVLQLEYENETEICFNFFSRSNKSIKQARINKMFHGLKMNTKTTQL